MMFPSTAQVRLLKQNQNRYSMNRLRAGLAHWPRHDHFDFSSSMCGWESHGLYVWLAGIVIVEMEHLKRENEVLRNELQVHKAMLNQAQDTRELVHKVFSPSLSCKHQTIPTRNGCLDNRQIQHMGLLEHKHAKEQPHVPVADALPRFTILHACIAIISSFALAQAAQAETTALQQHRQVEHLTEQLRQRELDLRAKQLELESEIVGRRLAESQCAKAEDSARQDTERAQRALEVTFHARLSCDSRQDFVIF